VVNYPMTQDYTRVTEYKHLTSQEHARTALTCEFPSSTRDRYYPIPKADNQELYKKYERLALVTLKVWFVGRLATCRYYNMDQIVGQALGLCPASGGKRARFLELGVALGLIRVD
jgi:UDP-galactopyranose mutase